MSEKELLRSYKKGECSPVLVIHGGAGIFDRSKSTPEQRELYKSELRAALLKGYDVLSSGGTAMDAAVAAVVSMEDCPLFNCAKGAVFNIAGKNELEASVMCSKPPSTHPQIPSSRRGFSTALLTRTKNPARLVRELYLRPDLAPHAFLSGSNAELELGHEKLGLEIVDPSYFWTEKRWREHREGLGLPVLDSNDHDYDPVESIDGSKSGPLLDLMPTGTVGAVALDKDGCIVALTSTGGKTNKLVGRIGDTPSMGSGFWAEEWAKRRSFFPRIWRTLLGKAKAESKWKVKAVGVSGTGDGDYFIRHATCATLGTRMKLLGESTQEAADEVVDHLARDGGIGGVIALDNKGNVAFSINCSGMYRGYITADGKPLTAIFKEDILE